MKHFSIISSLFFIAILTFSCGNNTDTKKERASTPTPEKSLDKRISLGLNAKQKNHQLKNMRSHLEAIQSIIQLIAQDKFDEASVIAHENLGSTTKMRLMCASFGNEEFENLGLEFHDNADKLSEILLTEDKTKSLEAVGKTMNYCVQCHATFRQ